MADQNTIYFSLPFMSDDPDGLECHITPINLYHQPYEANVEANGNSYHILFGQHNAGWFLCVPNWQIGVELSTPDDLFWNTESLNHSGVDKNTSLILAYSVEQISNAMMI